MEHADWMKSVWGDQSTRSVAIRVGLPPRTLANYVDRGELPAEAVIAVAVAFDLHPVGALVDTDYLDPKYAVEVDPVAELTQVTDAQIADEVLRRMKIGSHPKFETPIDELDTENLDADVRELPTNPDGTLDISQMKGAASRRTKEMYPETPDDGC